MVISVFLDSGDRNLKVLRYGDKRSFFPDIAFFKMFRVENDKRSCHLDHRNFTFRFSSIVFSCDALMRAYVDIVTVVEE